MDEPFRYHFTKTVEGSKYKVSFFLDEVPGLCSALIASNITCFNLEGPPIELKYLLSLAHRCLIEASCDFEQHYLMTTDNDKRDGVCFRNIADHMGYERLSEYKSRVTDNTCYVFGYNISSEEKNEFGEDPLSDWEIDEDDEEDLF